MSSPNPASENPAPTNLPAPPPPEIADALSDRLMKAVVRPAHEGASEADLDALVEQAMGDVKMEDVAKANRQMQAAGGPAGMKRGKITKISKDDVFVDVGGKSDGVLPKNEFDDLTEIIVGKEILVSIVRYDQGSGALVLSKRLADNAAMWNALKVGDVLDGTVTGMNKGGLELKCGGIRAFMPASQIDTRRIADISVFLRQNVRVKVTAIDLDAGEVVASRRAVLEVEQAQSRQRLLNELTEGETRTGTVRNITEFGAFVDIGGADGLLHIGDISWARVRSVGDVLKVDDVIEVMIIRVDKEKGKISLGLKQIKPDPWTGIADRFPIGSRTTGKVVRLAPFGAFVELTEGVDGLIHISEMSWLKRVNHPSELVKEGDFVEVAILKIDPTKRELRLGMKQISENPWVQAAGKFAPQSVHKGKVTRTSDFGAFVELEPGIEGLVHISELADKHVNRVTDVVQAGKEVDVYVIGVDTEARRVALSIKKAAAPPAPPAPRAATTPAAPSATGGLSTSAPVPAPPEPAKKRDKPLRGGLGGGFKIKLG